MSEIYQYKWILQGTVGHTYSTVHFLFIIQKNRKVQEYKKKYKTYTKIKFYIILI